MPRLFSIRPGIAFKGRKFKGIRGWAGKPSHPPLTDIPIGAYILAATFDVVSFFLDGDAAQDFFAAGTYVIIGGAVVSLATIVTGFWDWWKGLERDRSTGFLGRAAHTQVWRTANWHMTVMLTVTAIVIVDIIVRLGQWDQGQASTLVTILTVVVAGLVSYGAAYGGSLVYDYQFNIESLDGSTVWDETEVDQMPGEKGRPS